LKPEIDNAWEFGGEYSFPTDTTVSATYFENNLTDLIYTETVLGLNGFTTSSYSNAGKADIKGAEAEVKQQILPSLSGYANYTYLDPRIVENSAVPSSVGMLIPNISQHTANIGLDYKWKKFDITYTQTFASKRYRTSNNSDTTDGVQGSYDPYSTGNIRISYAYSDSAKFYFGVDNVTDQTYYTNYLTPGRTFNLGGSFKFL
jgi:iron complex outermembrane receptor protein